MQLMFPILASKAKIKVRCFVEVTFYLLGNRQPLKKSGYQCVRRGSGGKITLVVDIRFQAPAIATNTWNRLIFTPHCKATEDPWAESPFALHTLKPSGIIQHDALLWRSRR